MTTKEREETTAIIKSNEAHENYNQTIQCRANLQANFLVLGRLLQKSRNDGLFKFLGYDNFDEYLAIPEFKFHRSTAYKLIGLVELYCDRLKIPETTLVEIGTTNLDAIKGVVEKDVPTWLDKAEHLSKSDLLVELGKGPRTETPPRLSPPKSLASSPLPRMTPDQYIHIVKNTPCINCGRSDTVVQAHFPRTRVRAEKPWHVIPLCPDCHAEQEGSMEWCWKYRGNWARWFYNLIAGE